ncbi:hypothetical protein ES288_A05G242400v1 [Gossypium darwinii]|uniref:Uncharacterized protein n=1 Tax=Gossypium darwinii TaxID=34276 RepID=A0A5D2GJ22_GOSDA|nr:hypothetical protein ES288_A05G242400v1 [Gossypium darwinii]
MGSPSSPGGFSQIQVPNSLALCLLLCNGLLPPISSLPNILSMHRSHPHYYYYFYVFKDHL